MGWRFSLDSANVVGWLTTPDHLLPPIDKLDVREIRDVFSYIRSLRKILGKNTGAGEKKYSHTYLRDNGIISDYLKVIYPAQNKKR